MHRQEAEQASKRVEAACKAHNRQAGVLKVNIEAGDNVLRRKVDRNRGKNLSLKFIGHWQVNKWHEIYLFQILNLVSDQYETAHRRRLQFFRNKHFEVTEEVKIHLEYHENELQIVKSFETIRKKENTVNILVKWKVFGAKDSEWTEAMLFEEEVAV